MKVCGIHGQHGSSYYRMILPLSEMGRHGHDVTLIYGRNVRPWEMTGYPVIVGQRIAHPQVLESWCRFKRHSRLVYEVDDDPFTVERHNRKAYDFYTQPNVRRAIIRSVEAADLITVSTAPLADVMRQFNDNVVVLPNQIPGWACDLPRQDGPPTVGWVGGSSHLLDLARVASALRKFLDRFPGWRILTVGDNYQPVIRHDRVDFLPWLSITDNDRGYYQNIDFDIGIAPLDEVSIFNRSKSNIKALEYAARGIPVIASDAEPYRKFVQHGKTGFLVKRDYEWVKYLGQLAADENLRHEMGENARRLARKWTIEQNWTLWGGAYGRLR